MEEFIMKKKVYVICSSTIPTVTTKLKEWESGDSNIAQSLNEGIHKKLNLKLRAFNRGLLNKDLKKYNFQSITNRKILELMESERVELINDNEIIK